MKLEAVAWAAGIEASGEVWTEESLRQLAESAKGKALPVLLNFKADARIGTVEDARVEDGRLIVSLELSEAAVPGLVPRIGYQYRSRRTNGTTAYDDLRLISIGLCSQPSPLPTRGPEFYANSAKFGPKEEIHD